MVRIVTYNIRFDNPADGIDNWKHRRKHITDLLLKFSPDIISLQEPLHHQVKEIHEDLKESSYEWYGVGRSDGVHSGEFGPIFWNTNKLKALNSGNFWLSSTPEVPGTKFPSSCLPRMVTWCQFQQNESPNPGAENKPFFVFNTHFDHQGKLARDLSAEFVIKEIPKIAGLHPSILTGDFNAEPNSKAYQIVQNSFFTDARFFAKEVLNKEYGTFTGFCPRVKYIDNACETIDYIFTSGFEVQRFEVCLNGRPDNNRCLSDHRPLIVDCELY